MQATTKPGVWLLLLSMLLLSACASMGSGTNADKRQQILKMKNEALAELYALKPDVRAQLRSAPGYAVFSNVNVNLILLSAGTGYGVVKDAKAAKYTYMNMAEGGVGLGAGAKDYRIVMVFHKQAAIDHFIKNGWTFGNLTETGNNHNASFQFPGRIARNVPPLITRGCSPLPPSSSF